MEIQIAQPLSSSFVAPDGSRVSTPPLCRVRGIARPTPASHITFELWLPASGWNGRYYQLGNGGFAGNIHYPSLAAEAARGNAAALTDTGHAGDGFDARWAENRPERVIDYGHRSIKATSDAARALIRAYYGRSPVRRYFAGCSNGGRQAMMAAQRYPADWDGVIAGAPALQWTRQLATFAALQQRLRSQPANWIPPDKLPAIQRSALASCTPAAAMRNGVPGDPRFCRLDSRKLLCRGAETRQCLTRAQAATLDIIHTGFRNYPGFEPAAADKDNWGAWIVNPDRSAPSQLTFATQAYRHLFGGPDDWEVEHFDAANWDRALQFSDTLDADDPDLTRFRRRGGKLIMYHGWGDAVISPRATTAYYERVTARMGGAGPIGTFFRLFMVPGMAHCQGGSAPHAFGQSLPAPALYPDALHDIRRALETWVEKGAPPIALTAAAHAMGGPAADREIVIELRPYPELPRPNER